MLVKQLSVFLENMPGRVAEVTRILGEANVDISALVLSDTTDFGILRLIVDDEEKASKVLKANAFTVRYTNIIVIDIPDESGSLSKVLTLLGNESIGIEYMYAFLGRNIGKSIAALKIEDSDKALEVLKKNDIRVLSAKEI